MIKNGYTNSLAKLLLEKYREYLIINLGENSVIAKPEMIRRMEMNGENDILVFEATYNVKTERS